MKLHLFGSHQLHKGQWKGWPLGKYTRSCDRTTVMCSLYYAYICLVSTVLHAKWIMHFFFSFSFFAYYGILWRLCGMASSQKRHFMTELSQKVPRQEQVKLCNISAAFPNTVKNIFSVDIWSDPTGLSKMLTVPPPPPSGGFSLSPVKALVVSTPGTSTDCGCWYLGVASTANGCLVLTEAHLSKVRFRKPIHAFCSIFTPVLENLDRSSYMCPQKTLCTWITVLYMGV